MEQVIRRLKMGYNPKELQEIYGLSDEEMADMVKNYSMLTDDDMKAVILDTSPAPKKRGRPKKAVIA